MAKIHISSPEGQQERELAPMNSLGRHPNNSIQLLDRIVSKEHCTIELRGVRYVLRDLGSLNGTFINGQRIQGEAVLSDGDEVALGNTRLTFRDPQSPRVSQAPGYPGVPQQWSPQTPQPQQPGMQPPGMQPPAMQPAMPMQTQQPPVGAYNPQTGAPAQVGAAPGQPPAPYAQPAPTPSSARTNVTISTQMVESHIRTKIAAEMQQFLPEKSIQDPEVLRRDYEKLRMSYELTRAIGTELDFDRLLYKIIERAFDQLAADRGLILLYNEDKKLEPRAVLSRRATSSEENFVVSQTLVRQVEQEKVGVLSSDALLDPRFSQAHSIIMQGIRSSMAVPLLYKNELLGIVVLDSQISTNAFTEKDLQLFTNIANQASLFVENARLVKNSEREAIARERFQRLMSPQVAELVLKGKAEVKQGGEPRAATMLFSDIRGFTRMSEGMNAEDIVQMLNEYFEAMVEIIFRNQGTLDKFVGDEIMALFGAPFSSEEDPVRAVRAALEMLDALRVFNRQREAAGKAGFEIGVGVNTGQVVAGYLGSSKAMQYTVIGAPVNLAARLCSKARGMQVLISEDTLRSLGDRFEVQEVEPMPLKGIDRQIKIYEVLREIHGSPTMVPNPPSVQ